MILIYEYIWIFVCVNQFTNGTLSYEVINDNGWGSKWGSRKPGFLSDADADFYLQMTLQMKMQMALVMRRKVFWSLIPMFTLI